MSEVQPLETPHARRSVVPNRVVPSDYPLIDNDPHFFRVVRYARPSDWAQAAGIAAFIPGSLYAMERISPFPGVSKNAYKGPLRAAAFSGLVGGFLLMYTLSCTRFYGFRENRREIEKDMREMTDRVKAGLKPYGESRLTEYMQGVASRNTRYSGLMLYLLPWFNFVNHPHHGVDTAKYYQNAERELEAERTRK